MCFVAISQFRQFISTEKEAIVFSCATSRVDVLLILLLKGLFSLGRDIGKVIIVKSKSIIRFLLQCFFFLLKLEWLFFSIDIYN